MATIKVTNPYFHTIYIFRSADVSKLPFEFVYEFMKIYDEFKAKFKPNLPTKQSFKRAQKLLVLNAPETIEEKKALQDLKRIRYCKNVFYEARKEYTYAINKILDKNLGMDICSAVDVTPHNRKAITLDYLLRHDCVMPTLQKLSRLRCKIRKSLRLAKNARVGF